MREGAEGRESGVQEGEGADLRCPDAEPYACPAILYSAFRRLEKAELITSYWGDEGVGARRRYYKITELGRETYRQNKKDWEESKKIIDSLI